MKKILIISYNFVPLHTVGSIRPTKLASALVHSGHSVDVVTVKPFGKPDYSMGEVLSEVGHVYRIDRPIVIEKTKTTTNSQNSVQNSLKKKDSLVHKLKLEAREFKKIINSKRFANEFKKLVLSNKEQFSQYEVVFSTYGPIASHLCGLIFKKLFPKVLWIADFRDPMVVNMTTPLTRGYKSRLQNKICKCADKLVAVSNGYFNRIFGEKYKNKASVIYNGFDRKDIDIDSVEQDGQFSFVYVGSLYDGKRDLSVLFEVLSELISENKIKREDVYIKYAGISLTTLMNQAKKYSLEDRILDYGLLERKKCLELQASCRQLVLSTWNEKGELGVFPGKFLEYIMMGKPIVALVSGDEPDSEVALTVEKARLGICYEEATAVSDKSLLKEYILSDYLRFKNGEAPYFDSDKKEVDRFDFVNAAHEIEALF